jgi:hypothetical protein
VNVESGSEAAQFPEKEYVNVISFAVNGTRLPHASSIFEDIG